jgi:hypothetical protein
VVNPLHIIHPNLGGPALKRADVVAMAPLLEASLSSGFTAGGRMIHIINTRGLNTRSDLIIAVVITASWSVYQLSGDNDFNPHLYQLHVVPLSGPKEEIVCHWKQSVFVVVREV